MKYLVLISGILAILLAPVLFFSGLMIEDTRFLTGTMVLLAGLASVLSLIMICGRFLNRFSSSDFWLSLVMLILVSPIIILYIAGLEAAHNREKRAKANTGHYNLKLLGNNLLRYAREKNNYRLPPANSWCDILLSYNNTLTHDNFKHPKPEVWNKQGECHFAFNNRLSEIDIRTISDDTVLLFEADGKWNLNGQSELLKLNEGVKLDGIEMFYKNGDIRNYWFYVKAVRIITARDGMLYRDPKWEP